jgi:hypothetical protein
MWKASIVLTEEMQNRWLARMGALAMPGGGKGSAASDSAQLAGLVWKALEDPFHAGESILRRD